MARLGTAVIATLALVMLLGDSAGLASGELLILFSGVTQIHGKSATATATVTANGIANIRELPLQNGAELSPSGKYIAFDTCDRSDSGIAVATVENSQRRMVVPGIDGELCVAVRWSKDERQISYAGTHDYMVHIVSPRVSTRLS
jgi:hypothetical protein